MGRDLELKTWLERAGLTVTEIYGWRERGSSSFSPRGSVNHHTAGPRSGVERSLGICINGRSDVPGPLCNVHGPREESMRVNLVAAGRANHAGRGGTRGLVGNSSVYGLEEEHCGYADEPISRLRVDRMARVHAAFSRGRWGSYHCVQHYQWTPRKIDFVRELLAPSSFGILVDHHIARLLAGGAPLPPLTGELTMDREAKDAFAALNKAVADIRDDMARKAVMIRDSRDGKVWVIDGDGRWHIRNRDTIAVLAYIGMISMPEKGIAGIPVLDGSEWLDSVPITDVPPTAKAIDDKA